jgi:hypothetical protein
MPYFCKRKKKDWNTFKDRIQLFKLTVMRWTTRLNRSPVSRIFNPFQNLKLYKVIAVNVIACFFFNINRAEGPSPLGTAATSGLLHKTQMIDEGDCGAIGGTKIGRGNRITRRKPDPAPLCPPQIPDDQTRARTRAAAVGSQRVIAWAMARPNSTFMLHKPLQTGPMFIWTTPLKMIQIVRN